MHPKPPRFELGRNDDKDEDDHDDDHDDDDDDDDDKHNHKVSASLSKLETICFLIAHVVPEIVVAVGKMKLVKLMLVKLCVLPLSSYIKC